MVLKQENTDGKLIYAFLTKMNLHLGTHYAGMPYFCPTQSQVPNNPELFENPIQREGSNCKERSSGTEILPKSPRGIINGGLIKYLLAQGNP